jgi:hypothetical protein
MGAGLLGIDLETWGGIVLGAATLIGGAAALVGLSAALRGWYRRTLGRRQERYERLARLGAGAHRSFFEAVLGEPPAMSRSFEAELPEYDPEAEEMVSHRRAFRQHFFIDRDYYVQAVCDPEETVLAFSVTTRSKRFKPRFSFPPRARPERWWRPGPSPLFSVKLGHTRFGVLRDRDPNHRPQIKATSGARTYSYTEALYLGNPGYYQHYCFTASSAAHLGPIGPIMEVTKLLGHDWVGGIGDEDPERLQGHPVLNRFRAQTPITTYTVLGPHLRPESYPTTFGPHGDEVRTLP